MIFYTAVIIVMCELGGGFGQVKQTGLCPATEAQPKFDASLYMGRWFELEKFPSPFDANQSCISAMYSPKLDGIFSITITRFDDTKNSTNIIYGDAVQNPLRPAGELLERYYKTELFRGTLTQPYTILATDTDYTYSLIFSCLQNTEEKEKDQQANLQNEGNTEQNGKTENLQFLWIVSRNPLGLKPNERQQLIEKAKLYGIDTSYLTPTRQEGCPNPIDNLRIA